MIKRKSCLPDDTTGNVVPSEKDPPCPIGDDRLFSTQYNAIDQRCDLIGSSCFNYTDIKTSEISEVIFIPDPSIQNTVLKYTDTSKSGFMKMQLSGPQYGFGSSLYSGIVSSIALQNAEAIAYSTKTDVGPLVPAAQLPFAPKVKSFSASYTASQTFVLINEKNEYPIQCFYYAPFENYTIYDHTANPTENQKNLNTSLAGTQNVHEGIPLFPSFNCDGALFLEMENLVVPNDISFYFELARSYGNASVGKKIDYYYLGAGGWENLTLLSDGTNNLSCSGIVKLNIPDKISVNPVTMPDKNYWISVAVNNPDALAQTVFLKTNGFEASRSGSIYLSNSGVPVIASNTITKPHNAIPQIRLVTQPFQSFGGKAEENPTKINERVSNRIKTKDRAISTEDYFRLIRQEYDDIYYSSVIYNPFDKRTEVYVVKAYKNWTDPSAFVPLISECKEEKIWKFLTKRASVFSNIRVSNFDFEYLKITASIAVKPGFEGQGFQKNINLALNIYLSPWITSNQTQVAIGQEISSAQVAGFIQSMDGVSKVESISFQIWKSDDTSAFKTTVPENKLNVGAGNPSILLLSCMNHDIQCKFDI